MFYDELGHLRSFIGGKRFELFDDFSHAHSGIYTYKRTISNLIRMRLIGAVP